MTPSARRTLLEGLLLTLEGDGPGKSAAVATARSVLGGESRPVMTLNAPRASSREVAEMVDRVRSALEEGDASRKLKCPKCDTVNVASASKCKNCGHDLAGARKAKFAKLDEAKLSSKDRKKLPKSAFVFPEKAPGPGSYPIHDEEHGRKALQLSGGKSEESTVRAAVLKRYPGLKKQISEADVRADHPDACSLPHAKMASRGRRICPGCKEPLRVEESSVSQGSAGRGMAGLGMARHGLAGLAGLAEAKDSLRKASTPEPFSTSTTSNWVARAGGLPDYVQHVAHDIHEKRGKSVSEAIQIAIGVIKNWASGQGNVDKGTRAAAQKALGEWEKMKAANKAKKAAKKISEAEFAAYEAEAVTLAEAYLREADTSPAKDDKDKDKSVSSSAAEAGQGLAGTGKARDGEARRGKASGESDATARAVESSGKRVMHLQNRLNELGFDVVSDGRFGSKTASAVKDFQRSAMLKDDGIVGPATTNALKQAPRADEVRQANVEDPAKQAQFAGEDVGGTAPQGAKVSGDQTPSKEPDTPSGAQMRERDAQADAKGITNEQTGTGPGGGQPPAIPVLTKGVGVGEKSGDKHVRQVQSSLAASGADINADGRFGPETERHVKRFQRKWGLKPSGIVDDKTRRALAHVAGRHAKLHEAVAARQAASGATFTRLLAREALLRAELSEGRDLEEFWSEAARHASALVRHSHSAGDLHPDWQGRRENEFPGDGLAREGERAFVHTEIGTKVFGTVRAGKLVDDNGTHIRGMHPPLRTTDLHGYMDRARRTEQKLSAAPPNQHVPYDVHEGRELREDWAEYDAGRKGEGITKGAMSPNKANLSLKDMPLGTTFEMNDGSQYKVHKAVGDPFYIVKPLDGGKAKPLHKMFAPPKVGPVAEGYGEPDMQPAGGPEGDLFGLLSKSVAMTEKAKAAGGKPDFYAGQEPLGGAVKAPAKLPHEVALDAYTKAGGSDPKIIAALRRQIVEAVVTVGLPVELREDWAKWNVMHRGDAMDAERAPRVAEPQSMVQQIAQRNTAAISGRGGINHHAFASAEVEMAHHIASRSDDDLRGMPHHDLHLAMGVLHNRWRFGDPVSAPQFERLLSESRRRAVRECLELREDWAKFDEFRGEHRGLGHSLAGTFRRAAGIRGPGQGEADPQEEFHRALSAMKPGGDLHIPLPEGNMLVHHEGGRGLATRFSVRGGGFHVDPDVRRGDRMLQGRSATAREMAERVKASVHADFSDTAHHTGRVISAQPGRKVQLTSLEGHVGTIQRGPDNKFHTIEPGGKKTTHATADGAVRHLKRAMREKNGSTFMEQGHDTDPLSISKHSARSDLKQEERSAFDTTVRNPHEFNERIKEPIEKWNPDGAMGDISPDRVAELMKVNPLTRATGTGAENPAAAAMERGVGHVAAHGPRSPGLTSHLAPAAAHAVQHIAPHIHHVDKLHHLASLVTARIERERATVRSLEETGDHAELYRARARLRALNEKLAGLSA